MTKAEKQILEQIKDNFALAEAFYSKDYQRNKEDVAFVLGDQWDTSVKKNRQKFKQPCLTENHLLPFALKVINGIRQARPAVKVLPVDDESDVETAEIYGGIVRNIEHASKANNLYDTTALNAIMSARGFLKVGTKYANNKSFEQEITLSCAQDPFKCYLDPASKELDGSDANWYIEYEEMTKEDFKKNFPNKSYDDVKADAKEKGWITDKTVRVVDYYCKEYQTKTLYKFFDGTKVVTEYELPDGLEAIDERESVVCSIKHVRATCDTVLKETDVIGENLPIVPVYGLVVYNNGKREVYSLIHQAKDPQRMLNYWKSASAEIVALQPKSPWVGAKGSFANNAPEWAKANIENIPFLEYEPVVTETGQIMPPPQRAAVPQGSAIMVQEGLIAADGIKATLGIYESSLGQMGNEVSGIAIERRQLQGDNATYHFVDNLVASMQQLGRIMVGMIPQVYNEKRVMRIVGEDGEPSLVGVNQLVEKQGKDLLPVKSPQPQDLDKYSQYDLEAGKYDVVVDIGSSYATRRQETFDLLRELMVAVPQVAEAAPDLLIKSFDVQYSDEIAKRVRAVMNPALLADDVAGEQILQLTQALEGTVAELEQAKIALQIKDENQQIKNTIAMREVDIKRVEAETNATKVRAEIEKLNAQSRIEIPSQAMKDKADAMEAVQGKISELEKVLELLLTSEEQKTAQAVETNNKEST